jgi:hypothetical protein
MPPRVLARTPRFPGRSRTPSPSAAYKKPSRSRETLATPLLFPFRRRYTRRGEEGGRGGEGGREGEGAPRGGGRCCRTGLPPPGLRPNDDVDAAARPARLRPSCSSPPLRQASSLASKPTSECRRRSPIPCCRCEPQAADDPSIASLRAPFPIRPSCCSCAGAHHAARRARSCHRPFAATSCRGPRMLVPCARHGHAAALRSQDLRACVRTHTARPSRAPHCAAPPLHHDPVVRGHPQRGGQALSGIPSSTLGALATRTLALTHTRDHPGPEPHRIWRPHQIRWETDKWAPPAGGKRGARPPGPVLLERERENDGL